MDPRLLAKLIAAGRLVIGSVLLAKPEVVTSHWVGSTDTPVRALAAGLGIRDVVLGAGVLSSLAGDGARPWLVASAVADFGDLVGTLRNKDGLPGTAVLGTVALAGGSAALGAWLAAQDDFA